MDSVLHHLRRTAAPAADTTDGQLLEQFLTCRAEAAFAELVRRHGPMVFGVCRRVLGHVPDAEDAFQATFLVLVQRAGSVRPREQVGHWLYGVACHVARRARTALLRRRAKEKHMDPLPEPAAADADRWGDLRPLLDQELRLLPERYRIPVVLCDLEGRTRAEAARQLGWPEGTVSGRLSRARKLLARRLARHGVTLSGPAVAALCADHARAAVPATLAVATVRAGTLAAAGVPLTTALPGPAAALAEGVVRTMTVMKWLSWVVSVAALALILGAAVAASQPAPDDGAHAPNPVAVQPQAQPAQPQPLPPQPPNAPAPGVQPKPDQPVKGPVPRVPTDEELLQGRWQLVRQVRYGVETTDPVDLRNCYLVVKGAWFEWLRRDERKCLVHLDNTQRPRSLRATPEVDIASGKGQGPLAGIYELTDDRLVLCINETFKQIPPRDFKVMPKDNRLLQEFIRAPEDAPKPDQPAGNQTSWGQEVGGVQLGLCLAADQRATVRVGDKVQVVVKVRHTGAKPLTVTAWWHTFQVEALPRLTDGGAPLKVLPGFLNDGDPIPLACRDIAPGTEVVLTTRTYVVRGPDGKAAGLEPTILAVPGRYRLSLADVPLTAPGGKYSTGQIDLEILPGG